MGYSVLVQFDEEAIQRPGYGVAEARRIATDRPDLLRLRSAQALDRQKQVARDDNQPHEITQAQKPAGWNYDSAKCDRA